MARCKPGGLALIIRSHNGNAGKVVMTMSNEGELVFRNRGPVQNVWTVKAYSTPLLAPEYLTYRVKAKYGEDIDGLYPEVDLLPMGDPGLLDLKHEYNLIRLNEKLIELRAREKIFQHNLRKTNTG